MFYRKQERFPDGSPRGMYVDERAPRNNLLFWVWFVCLVLGTLFLIFYQFRPNPERPIDLFNHRVYWRDVGFMFSVFIAPVALSLPVAFVFPRSFPILPMGVWTLVVVFLLLIGFFPEVMRALVFEPLDLE